MTKQNVMPITALVVAFMILAGSCTAVGVVGRAAIEEGPPPCGEPVDADTTRELPPVPEQSQLGQPELEALIAGGLSADFDPSQPVVVMDLQGLPIVVGPAWPIEIARVTPEETSPEFCHMRLTLSDRGLDGLNQVARLCVDLTADCPFGRVATVIDGRTVWAPTINAPFFEEPDVVLSTPTGIAPADGPDVAAALAGSAQFRIVLFDPGLS